MEIRKVGVAGCGVMGSGIAEVCARSGYDTLVREVNEGLLDKGLKAITSSLTRAQSRGRISQEEKEKTLGRIRGTTALEDFRDRDMVIEAVVEKVEEKKKVFASLDRVCAPGTILASNTSSLPIIELAMSTRRPERVLGIHFLVPAPVIKLIELATSIVTSEETLQSAREFCLTLGKEVVVVQDSPGFIFNRLFIPYLLDAVRMLEAGVASKEDIDRVMTLALNQPLGPLAIVDLSGLDTTHLIAEAMYQEIKDPRYASPPLLRKMIAAGRLGRKTGQGFYQY